MHKSAAAFLILTLILTVAIPVTYGAEPVRIVEDKDNGSDGDNAYAGIDGSSGDDGSNGDKIDYENNEEIDVPEGVIKQGIYAKSPGGNGGDGGDGIGAGSGYDGGDGGNGGTVIVSNNGAINSITSGEAGLFGISGGGIFAISVGGKGGDGGNSEGLAGNGGDGGAGGNGGTVTVTTGISSSITTQGDDAGGIYASSISGNGGQGGDSSGVFYGGGGDGSDSGKGGTVEVSNNGTISTNGQDAYGIFAESVGGFAGNGGGGYGIVGYGGGSTSGGDGGSVTVHNYGSITTGLDSTIDANGSSAIFAQSVGGGGGSAGSGGGLVGLGNDGANGGSGGALSITNSGTLFTYDENSKGIFAQSIGGGGGDGGHSGGVSSVGGSGSGGGKGSTIRIENNNGGDITTYGAKSEAILAQSIGGGGGDAGNSGGLMSVGGSGDGGGNGGTITVLNYALLTTSGADSRGIFAQSIGGGGGNGGHSGGVISIGGSGDGGGNGGKVTVDNYTGGDINTKGANSDAIFAQSVGGGGGNGGTSGGMITVGGSGGAGGNGIDVVVYNEASLTTAGTDAKGIFAQSIGGGGGNGGGSYGGGAFFTLEVGGSGNSGGNGGSIILTSGTGINNSTITTTGDRSFGIFAQSIGGGGGNGGNAVGGSAGKGFTLSAVIGGRGGSGGDGGGIVLVSKSEINTGGNDAHGIYAQSVGGGGGDGGYSIAVSGGNGFAGGFSLGGKGGSGGNGSLITVVNQGGIDTSGNNSYGIKAQSIGGGGGTGGFSFSGSLGEEAVTVAIGGSGGDGGNGNTVRVTNDGWIETSGNNSYGILAQSIGGGGGDGAFSFAGALGKKGELAFSLGGSGGDGGLGGAIILNNNGSIETFGLDSHGILAQSIGGGGGNGGNSYSFAFGKGESNVAVGTAVGGAGGSGATGNTVEVTADAGSAITTWGANSYGINAQSIGGGGGNGGSSFSMDFSKAGTDDDSKSTTINISVGGAGGAGNTGGAVTVNSAATIYTYGNLSYGISGQSIGGGGGNGGNANAVTLSLGGAGGEDQQTGDKVKNKNWNFTVAVGGNGGSGNDGGTVGITNSGSIFTMGELSSGIVAQSIGGGGGNGGAGVLGSGITEFDAAVALVGKFGGSKTGQLHSLTGAVGGNGGSNGDGKSVTVLNSGDITTMGLDAYGIFAQSVGGGGGLAQHFAEGEGDGGSVAVGMTGKLGIGGAGGSAGDGDTVTITNSGNIETWGGGSYGILAQSIGGGGGVSGNVTRGLATFIPDGGVGIGIGYGQDGGSGGNGGTVTINNSGNIVTHGAGANGIFAQSIGGGGGINGSQGYGPDTILNYIPGIDFSGSTGGFGGGGTVNITQTGNITTTGDAAHGIFAQSAGSRTYTDTNNKDQNGVVIGDDSWKEYTGVAGDINITVKTGSSIIASGKNSDGIFAQSLGQDGNGDITITIEQGAFVQGGTENGHGVAIKDGGTNTLNNYGTITALSCSNPDGYVVYVEDGNQTTINNYGLINGNIKFEGSGNNTVNNLSGKLVESGLSVDLGGGTFVNSGTLSPGGSDSIQTTNLNGNLIFENSGPTIASMNVSSFEDSDTADSSKFAIELDGRTTLADQVNVSGTVTLGGTLNLNLLNPGRVLPGTYTDTILTSSAYTGQFQTFNYQNSAVVNYRLVYDSTGISLNYTADFAAAGLNGNQTALGNYFNTIQKAGGTDGLAPIVADLVSILDVTTLGSAYDQLSPYTYDNTTRAGIELNRQFLQPLRQHMNMMRASCTPGNSPGQNKNGGWFDGFVADGDGKGVIPTTDFTYQANGNAMGYDIILANGNGLIGFGIGNGQSELNSGTGGINGTAVSLYGYSWLSKQTYIEGLISYDSLAFDNQRTFMAGSSEKQAYSSHDGQSFMLSLGGGYFSTVKNWSIETTAVVEFINLAESEFKETGAGSVNLDVQSRNTQSSFLRLGLNAIRDYKFKYGKIVPEFGATYIRNIGYDGRDITASFTDYPKAAFTVEGHPLAEDCIAVNLGIGLFTVKGFSFKLSCMSEWYESCQNRSFALKIGSKF